MTNRDWVLIGVGVVALYLIYRQRTMAGAAGTTSGAAGSSTTAGTSNPTNAGSATAGGSTAPPATGGGLPPVACVAIWAPNGHYLNVNTSDGRVSAMRTAVDGAAVASEVFRLIPLDTAGAVSLQHVVSGKYLRATSSGLWADRAAPAADTRFAILPSPVSLRPDRGALQTAAGAYVTVDAEGHVTGNGGQITAWQTFTFKTATGC